METRNSTRFFYVLLSVLFFSSAAWAQIPTITGPATVAGGITAGQVYTTEPGMTGYLWTVSSAGTITIGAGTASITVDWLNPIGNQAVSVTYAESIQPTVTTVLNVLYYPFPAAIDPATIPQFVDPVPHFAAGLRVDAKAGGNLVIKAVEVQQIALSTGTVLSTGTIGDPLTPNAGKGNYAVYAISKDGGSNFGPAMWPAQTIEAKQGNQLVVNYRNDLFGAKYSDFNILADQTLMMNGYTQTGNPQTDPYTGDIPMVVHLHGGEMPSNSDGGPTAWFTPGYAQQGPGFALEASSLCTYPNMQEGTTLWYHPHDQGLTRINVYTGLAGFYFLRGTNDDALKLPGWSGDGKVREVTPAGKTPTFNGSKAYLPEIELAIQDRMFNDKGELYWPVAPTNPEVNPYWTPEFFGDVMTVNGKSWPYLSVASRKYAFRILDGCNARFLNMWLSSDPITGVHDGPSLTIIQSEGGLLDAPVVLDPSQTLFLAPAERPTVIIDFTGYADGTVFYLMNDANAPYPNGDPVISGLTDRIMQFVVNGTTVGADVSVIPALLRPTPMVKLTNFDGTLNVTPTVKRRLILNEIMGPGGPLRVAINNSHFDEVSPTATQSHSFGGPTEIATEGTTELWEVVNTTGDAHPMHIHLTQWQLVSRRPYDDAAYMATYSAAWAAQQPTVPNYPADASYPGGAGSPYNYNTASTDGYLGGNPIIPESMYLGPAVPALPEERGWKDAIKAMPGEVATYIARYAPTDLPLTATAQELVYPFDPSEGPGFVWHCHIIDHEDMDMMRPLPVNPSSVRFPNITIQPADISACNNSATVFKVTATSINAISYLWQLSTNGGTVWNDLTSTSPYSNVTASGLNISPLSMTQNTYKFRCKISTIEGFVYSGVATLTVNPLPTVTVTTGSPNNFFYNLTLTANPFPADNYTYLWKPTGETTRSIMPDNSSPDGLYSVVVTNTNGCSMESAPYNFQKQNLVNSFRILGIASVNLSAGNFVQSGSVGTTLPVLGTVTIGKNSTVAGPGAFVKSKRITVDPTANVPVKILAQVMVMPPAMRFNLTTTKGLLNLSIPDNKTVVYAGNYNNVTIGKNCKVTFTTGTIFGRLVIDANSQATFNAPSLNFQSIEMLPGTITNKTKLLFGSDVAALVRDYVLIRKNSEVNTTGNFNAVFYISGIVGNEFQVMNGGNVTVNASVYAPLGNIVVQGDAVSNTYMNGTYIAARINSKNNNIYWDSKVVTPLLKSAVIAEPVAVTPVNPEPNVKVYPNPFTEKLNIEFSSTIDTQAKLEIFNILGAKLETLFDGNIIGGQTYYAEFIPRLNNSQMVIYRLTMGDKTTISKLIYQER